MAGVDKGVTDLAPTRVQIRSIVAGAEVGDPDLACTIVEARVQKCMREGVRGWRVERESSCCADGV